MIQDVDQEHLKLSQERMQMRIEEHTRSLPLGYAEAAEEAMNQIPTMNARAAIKLNKIYSVLDEYSELRAPHVACKQGCDDCCHMNLQITSLEAERIEKAAGRKAKVPRANTFHKPDRYAGVPCPFLKDRACSIYADRPLMCRAHASFDDDAYWCAPERMNTVTLPLVEIKPAKLAVSLVAMQAKAPSFADIREFFPPG